MKAPSHAAESCPLASGVVAVAPGLAWLPASRSLVAADAHFAYEEVVGGALPLWSTAEIVATLTLAAARLDAREIVFLGDIVHGAHMSEGAKRAVAEGLELLRTRVELTLVAGNHEGRSRAFRILGATVEACERAGWLLVHGDRPATLGTRTIIGHLHPSLSLDRGASVPAFVASDALVVVPALTPYSPGLDLLSEEFAAALGLWAVARRDAHVVAVAGDRVFPFGSLATLRATLRGAAQTPARGPAQTPARGPAQTPARVPARFRKPRLRPDR